jgi:hypothetical protein
MSYRDPQAPDVPETDPVTPEDLPGSEEDDDGDEIVPFEEPEDDPSAPPVPEPDSGGQRPSTDATAGPPR